MDLDLGLAIAMLNRERYRELGSSGVAPLLWTVRDFVIHRWFWLSTGWLGAPFVVYG